MTIRTNRITKLKERKYKDANLIAYLQEQIYMLNHSNQRWLDLCEELLDREILKDAIFFCHPDRNDSEERPDRVTKWLNKLYELSIKKNRSDN